MPYAKRRQPNGKWRTYNSQTGKVHGRDMTEANADAQMRIMYAAEHGWKPTHKKSK